jgi:hypothetical protein
MNQLTDKIQQFFESYAFGVCTHLGHTPGRKARNCYLQHPFILHLRLFPDRRIAGNHLPLDRLCHEHAQTPAQAKTSMGLLIGRITDRI